MSYATYFPRSCYATNCNGTPVTVQYWYYYAIGICGTHVIALKAVKTKTWFWC